MPEIKVWKCDGCGKIITSSKDVLHLDLKGDSFWDGYDDCQTVVKLGFCESCARQVKRYLADIAQRKV